MYYETAYDSPLGGITLASDGEHINGLWFDGQKYFGGLVPPERENAPGLEVFSAASDWLDRYFAGKRPDASELPLAPRGGAFRLLVWEILREIPWGQVTTYKRIAAEAAMRLQRPAMSAQAVGNAVAHNPISILIPCHRVVGTNGSLTGYAGGLDKKLWLLEHEGVRTEALFVPGGKRPR